MRANEVKLLNEMKKLHPEGTRVKLVRMLDNFAPPVGTEGTVNGVDSAAQIHVKWDTGSTLALIPGEDRWEIVK
jgi:hypothetical protein